jgi:hypothetical protein
MPELLTEPTKHLVLDTDWLTAISMIGLFFLCLFLAMGMAWTTLRGTFKVGDVSWLTPLLVGMLVYGALVVPDRSFRIAICVYAVGPVSHVVLWMMRASSGARLVNELFVRWIDSGVYLAGCVYAVYWFRRKITYV